jgi:hypothetical protein
MILRGEEIDIDNNVDSRVESFKRDSSIEKLPFENDIEAHIRHDNTYKSSTREENRKYYIVGI